MYPLRLREVSPRVAGCAGPATSREWVAVGAVDAVLLSRPTRRLQSVSTLEAISLSRLRQGPEAVAAENPKKDREPRAANSETACPQATVGSYPWASSLVRQYRWQESVDVCPTARDERSDSSLVVRVNSPVRCLPPHQIRLPGWAPSQRPDEGLGHLVG